jgi:hypothetical protein
MTDPGCEILLFVLTICVLIEFLFFVARER